MGESLVVVGRRIVSILLLPTLGVIGCLDSPDPPGVADTRCEEDEMDFVIWAVVNEPALEQPEQNYLFASEIKGQGSASSFRGSSESGTGKIVIENAEPRELTLEQTKRLLMDLGQFSVRTDYNATMLHAVNPPNEALQSLCASVKDSLRTQESETVVSCSDGSDMEFWITLGEAYHHIVIPCDPHGVEFHIWAIRSSFEQFAGVHFS